ncbi:hypothetical protein [Mariniflexile sp. HMF6888]
MNKEQLKKKIGQRIVELRSQKGWSQSDLALVCDKDIAIQNQTHHYR